MVQISVITPLYNGASTIADCLQSVAMQDMGGIEHLVIDNRSRDDGPAIVASAADQNPAIRLLSCPHRQGAGAARNVGLNAASGRWLAFLDADDRFLPGKLATQIAAMQARNLALSWTSYQVLRAPGRPLRTQRTPAHVPLRDLLQKRVVIGCSTVMIDRAAFGQHRFDEDLHLAEDFAMWLGIARDCQQTGLGFGGIPEILSEYRAHGGVSANKMQAARGHWAALRHGLGLDRGAALRAMTGYIRNALRDRVR